MDQNLAAAVMGASTSAEQPVKPPTTESPKDIYGNVGIDIKVEIVGRDSNKPKDKEMKKIFDIINDEVKIARPVGPFFRSIYFTLSKFNAEFTSLQKDPGAMILSAQFTSRKDIENFKKDKSKKELQKEFKSAFQGYLPGKNPYDKLDIIITIDPKKQIIKDVRTMKKESQDNLTEGENFGKQIWNKTLEMQEVDKHLEGLINRRCTLVADTECMYLLGWQKFKIEKDKFEANKGSKDEDDKSDQPKKKKKQENKTDENGVTPKKKKKKELKGEDQPTAMPTASHPVPNVASDHHPHGLGTFL